MRCSDKTIVVVAYSDILRDSRAQRVIAALSKTFGVHVLFADDEEEREFNDNGVLYRCFKKNGSSNFARYLSFVKSCCAFLDKKQYYAFYGANFFSALIGVLYKKSHSQTLFVYDAYELIGPISGEKKTLRNLLFYRAERAALRRCDFAIAADLRRGELMRDQYCLDAIPTVVRNISKLRTDVCVSDAAKSKMIDDFLSAEGPVAVYVGVIAKQRRLDLLFEEVLSSSDDIRLLGIGGGDDLDRIAQLFGSGRACFIGPVPHEQLGGIVGRCAFGLLSYPCSNLNNELCAPNKIFEYASVGLPMVATPNPTLDAIFRDTGIGECSSIIGDAIQTVLSDRERYIDNCDKFSAANSYEKEITPLMSFLSQED